MQTLPSSGPRLVTHLLVTQIVGRHNGSRSHALISAVLRQGFQARQNSAQHIGSVAAAGPHFEQACSPQNQARQLLLDSAGALTLHAGLTPDQRLHRGFAGTDLEHLQIGVVPAESNACCFNMDVLDMEVRDMLSQSASRPSRLADLCW